MAITSINGEVEGNVILFDRSEVSGEGRGNYLVLYSDVTIAGGETLAVKVFCNNTQLDEEYYEVDVNSLSYTATGKTVEYVLVPKDADKFQIQIDGLTNSDVNINVGLDNYYS